LTQKLKENKIPKTGPESTQKKTNKQIEIYFSLLRKERICAEADES